MGADATAEGCGVSPSVLDWVRCFLAVEILEDPIQALDQLIEAPLDFTGADCDHSHQHPVLPAGHAVASPVLRSSARLGAFWWPVVVNVRLKVCLAFEFIIDHALELLDRLNGRGPGVGHGIDVSPDFIKAQIGLEYPLADNFEKGRQPKDSDYEHRNQGPELPGLHGVLPPTLFPAIVQGYM